MSVAEAVEVARMALEQPKQHHAKILKNLKVLESKQQKAQMKFSEHCPFVQSLYLSLLAQVVISVEKARAQSLEVALKADKISGLQLTILSWNEPFSPFLFFLFDLLLKQAYKLCMKPYLLNELVSLHLL